MTDTRATWREKDEWAQLSAAQRKRIARARGNARKAQEVAQDKLVSSLLDGNEIEFSYACATVSEQILETLTETAGVPND